MQRKASFAMNAAPQEPLTGAALKMNHGRVQVKMTDMVTAVPVKGCRK